jgi:hypothetical protein
MPKAMLINCTRFVFAVWRACVTEKYSTKSLEAYMAFVMLAWSARVLWPGEILTGSTYTYLLMMGPEPLWGGLGVATALVWLFSLIRNGGWHKSPILRACCSGLGAMWWFTLSSLYSLSVNAGGADFPMRPAQMVGVIFCCYAVWRNSQDHAAVVWEAQRQRSSAAGCSSGNGVTGNGG